MPPFPESAAWHAVLAERDALASRRVASLWDEDPERGAAFTFQCAGIAVDFSRQRLAQSTLQALILLARERELPAAVERLFSGAPVNTSEDRPALHMALRGEEHVMVGEEDILPAIQRGRERMRTFSEAVREGHWKGFTGKRIRHVLAIGIGGSSLGPRLVVEALRANADGPEVRFVANIDPAELDDALADIDPEATLVVVASKTYTTQETMANANAAREWLAAKMGVEALARHVVAATAHHEEAVRWGLPECNVFTFGDWVGGRYSVWSSVGLPVAIALGMQRFGELLAGAHAVDLEFRSNPLEHNVPALLALVGIWNRNALGIASRAIVPYASRLAHLVDYLQQLEMESNGKRVDTEGRPVDFATCPVVWGNVGTPGQHAFHQWLHQGTDPAACDFVVVAKPMGTEVAHHDILLSHALAQGEALMTGVESEEPHRACPGDRVSTTFVLPTLDARHLGALTAIYEHKVFAEAAIWGTNAFDQFGVELGKRIAGRVLPAVRGEDASLHPATRHLVDLVARLRANG